MAKDDIKKYSLDDLDELVRQGKHVPTSPDAPEVDLDEEFWQNARVVEPDRTEKMTLRVKRSVLEFFKAEGEKGYQTRMNAVLESYVRSRQKPS